MGIYGEQVLPRIINAACGMKSSELLRERACAGLTGDVVEIGFGSGLNVPFYPDRVDRVTAVEPSDVGWKLADKRVSATGALTTWTLCTIPEVDAALGELRRVLKPGGSLHLVEGGLAPDEGVRRWQHRLEPIQRRVFGGCHLTRPVVPLLERAGFEIKDLDVFYEDGVPEFLVADSLGTAVSP